MNGAGSWKLLDIDLYPDEVPEYHVEVGNFDERDTGWPLIGAGSWKLLFNDL
jgi:hypothetical protein